MPIQTTGFRPRALPRRDPFWPASLSSSMAALISRRWRSESSSGAIDLKTFRASSSLPLKTRKRGDSGRVNAIQP